MLDRLQAILQQQGYLQLVLIEVEIPIGSAGMPPVGYVPLNGEDMMN
jgi:hypothetical protein